MNVIKISIPNWEKFNPRADRGNFHWFRTQNDFFIDQRVFQLDAESKLMFVFLLCEASRKNGEEFELSVQYASGLLQLKTSSVLNAVERLSSFQLVACNVFSDANGTERTERNERDGTGRDGTTLVRPPAPPLLEIWNENCGPLPKANAVSDKRLAAWQARWGDRPDRDYWNSVVVRLASSRFCCGDNDKGWKACIDFMLKPDTHLKTSEGKYDNHATGGRPKTREESVSAANQALYERVERGEA